MMIVMLRSVIRASASRNAAAALALALAGSGCAGDGYVPRSGETASQQAYAADLEDCKSAALSGRAGAAGEGFLAGALIGAANGAAAAAHGHADLGAAIGAGIGAIIGFTEGLAWSRGDSVDACMHRKGYRRA